jgi:CubicO group peptidase (beta-lactamase class C family)
MRFTLVAAVLPFVFTAGTVPAQPKAPTQAKQPAAAAPAAPGPTRGPTTKAEMEAFVDGLMTAWMRDKHIAGVTVSVVKDGALFFAKGYGYADVEKQKPVDPEKSLFRIGSISKLFTWTSVMQLKERGKLDLTKDINEYLDFKIPATYPEPITLTDVMTHTPGLEEDGRDLFTEDSAHITPMSKWLPAHMPARVRPPNTFASYSNWATATAGYIVERVGGEKTWDDYIEKNLLQPLDMTQTSSRQPLPARLEPDMSGGYQWKDGRFEAHKFEIVTGAAPAGSFSASATDMAKFMVAHLNDGAYGNNRILSEAAAQLMHSRVRGHDPRIPGFAYGFYEQSSHGLRIFGHGGDTQWFHSDLNLIPSEKLGIFMSTNTNTGSAISFEPFLIAFLDHYYPEHLAVIKPTPEAKQGAKRYAGEYLFNRMNFSTYQKALGLASPLPVKANDDGSLLVETPFGALRLVSVDSLLFRDVNSGTLVAFRADERGNITHGFLASAPMMVLDKQSASQAPTLHRNILIAALVMFVAILIAAVLRFFGRHDPGRQPAAPDVRKGRRLMATVALLQVLFVLVLVSVVSTISGLFVETPLTLKLGLVLPVLGLILTLGAGWFAVAQWRSGAGTIWSRLRVTGAVVVALAFFWSLNTWNLLGWKL